MKDEKFNFRALLNRIKEYYPLIILIPPILGGIWQIGVLSSISVSYIRFFSVTQLISDGLLILFLTGLIVLSLIISKGFIKFNNRILKAKWLIGLFYIIVGSFLTYISIKDLIIPFFNSKHFSIALLVFFIPMFVMGIMLFVHGIEVFVNTKKIKEFISFIYNDYTMVIAFFSILFIIYFLNFGWEKFRDTFHVPNNLKNIENINCYLSSQYDIGSNDYKFLYFNDKFIFIENRSNNTVKENIVINVEEMFNRSNCNK